MEEIHTFLNKVVYLCAPYTLVRAVRKHDTSYSLFMITLPATLNVLFNCLSKLVLLTVLMNEKEDNILRVTKLPTETHVLTPK